MKPKFLFMVAVLGGGVIAGCTSYYKVTDPHTQQVYYTDHLDRQQSGVVVFKDAKSNEEVTLAASQIQQIPKEQFDVGKYSSNPSNPSQPPTTRPAAD